MKSSPLQQPPLNAEQHADVMRRMRSILLDDPETIRVRYKDKPIELLRRLSPDMKFPKVIRKFYGHVWKRIDERGRKCTRFIASGPRGGGKTQGVGAISFGLWFLELYDVVVLGGSMNQSQAVYNYFIGHVEASDGIKNNLPVEPTMSRSETDRGNYLRAVAASEKQVRGPHPDALFIDEACEAKDQLILSALPMVNTSPRQLIVLTSTFHKIFGAYQDIWDTAEERGYMRFKWDAFDVCQEFDPAIWLDEELNEDIPDLHLLRKRARGRTGDPEGWIPIENIIQAWRERETTDWFDVEYMGSRPSAAGLINDPSDVDACVYNDGDNAIAKQYRYITGAEVVVGIDWGFSSMTSVVGLMGMADGIKSQLYNKNYSRVRLGKIIKETVQFVVDHRVSHVYGDSAGAFENKELQNAINEEIERRKQTNASYKSYKCVVIAVKFGSEKEEILGNYRGHFEKQLMRIPESHKVSVWQHKRYRYQENSDKPLKENDHVPDATMCCLKHWPLRKKTKSLDKRNVQQQSSRGRNTVTGEFLTKEF